MNAKTMLGLALLLAVGGALVVRHAPRGIRNNNPGNLMDFGIPWRGLIGRDDKGLAVFRTAAEGIRAMYIDLRTGFERDGEDTVREIITEYAPPSENPTEAYIAYVSEALDVGPDERLNLEADRVRLIETLIQFENGQQPYPRSVIDAAIKAA